MDVRVPIYDTPGMIASCTEGMLGLLFFLRAQASPGPIDDTLSVNAYPTRLGIHALCAAQAYGHQCTYI